MPIICSHKVDPNLNGSVSKFDIPLVFSAPDRLEKLCAKVNKCSKQSYRSVKNGTGISPFHVKKAWCMPFLISVALYTLVNLSIRERAIAGA